MTPATWHRLAPAARGWRQVVAVGRALLTLTPLLTWGAVALGPRVGWTAVAISVATGWVVGVLGAGVLAGWRHDAVAWLCLPDQWIVVEGVWWRQTTAVPLEAVQHVDVEEGPLGRALGIATLAVYTGTGGGADVVLAGLSHRDAETLRGFLVAAAPHG